MYKYLLRTLYLVKKIEEVSLPLLFFFFISVFFSTLKEKCDFILNEISEGTKKKTKEQRSKKERKKP